MNFFGEFIPTSKKIFEIKKSKVGGLREVRYKVISAVVSKVVKDVIRLLSVKKYKILLLHQKKSNKNMWNWLQKMKFDSRKFKIYFYQKLFDKFISFMFDEKIWIYFHFDNRICGHKNKYMREFSFSLIFINKHLSPSRNVNASREP